MSIAKILSADMKELISKIRPKLRSKRANREAEHNFLYFSNGYWNKEITRNVFKTKWTKININKSYVGMGSTTGRC